MLRSGQFCVTVEKHSPISTNATISPGGQHTQSTKLEGRENSDNSDTSSLKEDYEYKQKQPRRSSDDISIISVDDSLEKIVIDSGQDMVSFQPSPNRGDITAGSEREEIARDGRPARLLPPVPDVRMIGSQPIATEGEKTKSPGVEGTPVIKYNSIPRSAKQPKAKSKFYTDVVIKPVNNNAMPDSMSRSTLDDNSEGKVRKSSSSRSIDSSEADSLGRFSMPEASVPREKNALFKRGMTLGKSISNVAALKQTHIGIFTFIPRHKDELQLNEGDPLHVNRTCDDFWCEGINLITGKQGIFPCRYAADILADRDGFPQQSGPGDQFLLRFLGSVEVADYKGEEIMCSAIAKIVSQHKMLSSVTPQNCILQISVKGIRISEITGKVSNARGSPKASRTKKGKGDVAAPEDVSSKGNHFFSMKNVTYCGNHPRDRRYFAFITKHPVDNRYACHTFMSQYSTEQVTLAVGNCFDKFYEDYLEFRAPTEDIYIE